MDHIINLTGEKKEQPRQHLIRVFFVCFNTTVDNIIPKLLNVVFEKR